MYSHGLKRAWILLLGIATFSVGLQSTPTLSADGLWTTTSPGTFNWGDPLNWLNGGIASGAGGTASFSSVNPTGDIVVNLDTARTVGKLNFGDSDSSSAAGWAVSGTNSLTLDNTGGATGPVIFVGSLANGRAATINAPINASSGFTKLGSGTLVVGGTTTIGGPIVLDGGGILTFASNNSIKDLQFGAAPVDGVGSTFSNVLNVNGNVTATGLTAQSNSTNTINIGAGKTFTINGPITVGFDTSPSAVAPVFALNMIGGNLAAGNSGAF